MFVHYHAKYTIVGAPFRELFLNDSGWSIASKVCASIMHCTMVCCSQRSLLRSSGSELLQATPVITWGLNLRSRAATGGWWLPCGPACVVSRCHCLSAVIYGAFGS